MNNLNVTITRAFDKATRDICLEVEARIQQAHAANLEDREQRVELLDRKFQKNLRTSTSPVIQKVEEESTLTRSKVDLILRHSKPQFYILLLLNTIVIILTMLNLLGLLKS